MKGLKALRRVGFGAVCAITAVAWQPAAYADPQVVNGRVVIPVEEHGAAFDGDALGDATIKGGIKLRSMGGEIAHRLQKAVQAKRVPLSGAAIAGANVAQGADGRNDDVNRQVNDPALDHIVTFAPSQIVTRPFEFATQSETSAVRDGRHIVVGYNSSAGAEVQFFPGFGLAFTRLLLSGFSTSHDGGRTWSTGFVPAVSADAPFTFGDPSLAIDRRGNIFYTSLGTDAQGVNGTLIINKSSDHGTTFGAAAVLAVDNGSDKEWLAIGPDPFIPSRDNIYVTWTSFAADASGNTVGSEL